MTNPKLADDYFRRATGRLKAIRVLQAEDLNADVVRECQEACELALKALIRKSGHTVPFSHDVSAKLAEIASDLKPEIRAAVPRLAEISKSQRRDRELAFYGSEDVTPSEFYDANHAAKAISEVEEVLKVIGPAFQ